MDDGIFGVLKAVTDYLVIPLAGGLFFFMKKYIKRIEIVEGELQDTKTRTSVIESKVDDLRDDIKDIKCEQVYPYFSNGKHSIDRSKASWCNDGSSKKSFYEW